MIINKVILTNFRNHKNKEVKFSKGVNLLYGKNGAGKTSILEAIGFALFGGKTRTNISDSVTEGENKARIYVEFTTDNDSVYAVEKTFPKGLSKLVSLDDSNLKIIGQGEIQAKLLELLGMKINSESFFSDIVVASQNKITDIFIGTTDERRKRFDKLFDTEIYRQISEGYLKDMISELSKEYDIKSNEISNLKNTIIEPEILNNQFNEIILKKASIINTKKITDEKKDSIQKEIDQLRDYRNRIESTRKSIIDNNERRNDTKSRIISLNLELENSKLSKNIINSCKDDYEEYLTLSNQLHIIDKEISELEIIKNSNDKLKESFALNEKELGNLNTELKGKNERAVELYSELEIRKLNLSNLEVEIDNIKTDIKSISIINEKIDDIKCKVQQFENLIAQTEKSINNYEIEINSIETNIFDESVLKSDIEKYKLQIDDLQPLFEKKRVLEKESIEKYSRLSENNEAYNQLSDGICPFLTENCLNIGQGSSINQYFTSKEENLKNEISKIEFELDKLSYIENEDKKLRNEISKAEQRLIDNVSHKNKIEKLNEQILTSKTLLENFELKIDKEFSDNMIFINEINLKISKKNSSELQEYTDDLTTKLNTQKTIQVEKVKQFSSLLSEIQNNTNFIEDTQKRIEEISNQIVILEQKRISLDTEIQSNNNLLTPLVSLKQNSNELKSKLESLSENYRSYLQNLQSVERIPQIEKDLNSANESINTLNELEDELNNTLQELSSKYNDEIFNNKSIELDNIKDDIIKVESELQSIIADESIIKTNIKSNDVLIANYNDINGRIEFLDKKKKLMDNLRSNLKSMGQIISQKFIERIQIIATDNYKLISGRSESIIWKSDMGDAYQVVLKLNNGNLRNFELLSGGEQMMVAISLRAAMNSLLSNAKFVIFDEPTVNLDTERRKALSESLNHILNSLDQAIIVTHDDSFIETANNFIEL